MNGVLYHLLINLLMHCEVNPMEDLERTCKLMNRGFLWIGGVALILLMTLATANVALRPFGIPVRGSYELVGFLGAITIASALGYSQKIKMHIVVDILTSRYSKSMLRIANSISYFLCMVFFILVTWQTTVLATNIWKRGETSETLKLVYYPFIFIVSLGFAVFSLNLIVDLLKTIQGREE